MASYLLDILNLQSVEECGNQQAHMSKIEKRALSIALYGGQKTTRIFGKLVHCTKSGSLAFRVTHIGGWEEGGGGRRIP